MTRRSVSRAIGDRPVRSSLTRALLTILIINLTTNGMWAAGQRSPVAITEWEELSPAEPLTNPSPRFGQFQMDSRELERIRLRLSQGSIFDHWDPDGEPSLSPHVLSCADSRIEGRRDAAEHHSANRWWLSAPVGFFLPLLGIVAATGAAATVRPNPNTIPADVDARCYRDAYGSRARKRNTLTALAASSIGTVALIVAIVASGGFAIMPSAP